MRVSIPGLPGVYYDTDTESTALTVALTAAGRRTPPPKRYALQALPHLWSVDVDLHEVPDDHPLQYVHPEGVRSLEDLPGPGPTDAVGRDLDRALRFAWAVNEEVETAAERVVGDRDRGDEDAIVIEVEADGDESDADPFDVESDAHETDPSGRAESGAEDDEDLGIDEFDPTSDEFDEDYDHPNGGLGDEEP